VQPVGLAVKTGGGKAQVIAVIGAEPTGCNGMLMVPIHPIGHFRSSMSGTKD